MVTLRSVFKLIRTKISIDLRLFYYVFNVFKILVHDSYRKNIIIFMISNSDFPFSPIFSKIHRSPYPTPNPR